MLKTLLAASIVSLSAPLPQDPDPIPPIQEETPPAIAERPQSARHGLLFLYDVFEELGRRNGDLWFTGLWPASRHGEERDVELPDRFDAGRAFDRLGPAIVEIVRVEATYVAGGADRKDSVKLEVELRIRAKDVVEASLAYDFVSAALSSQKEVLRVRPADTTDLLGGDGIDVRHLTVDLDLAGRATRSRSGGGDDGQQMDASIRRVANGDRVGVGRLRVSPRQLSKKGWTDSRWRVTPEPRDSVHEFGRIYEFAYALERNIPGAVVTQLEVGPGKELGKYGFDLCLTRRTLTDPGSRGR